MKRLNADEIKEVLFDILCVFDEYCKKHDLKYWLTYGTLLGAIRHKDFIPWDDDIDVHMPRPDFDRFIECAKKDPIGTRYQVQGLDMGNSGIPFAKVIDTNTKAMPKYNKVDTELWIDVFPLDGIPEDKEKLNEIYSTEKELLKWYNRSVARFGTGETLFKKITRIPLLMYCRMKGAKHYGHLLQENAKQYPYNEEIGVCNMMWSDAQEREILTKDMIYPLGRTMFHGKEFLIINEYDKYLRSIYGNYMELPPEEKREFHTLEAYIIDEGLDKDGTVKRETD